MRARWLAAALLCHVVFAGACLLATPVFESPDEPGHFQYVRQLLEYGRPPLIAGSAEEARLPTARESSMGHHPPLYYAVLASLQLACGEPDLSPVPRRRANPDGLPHSSDLLWEHGFDEGPEVSREVGVFRLQRAFSILCGAITLLLIHRLGRTLFPEHERIADVAVLLLACYPQWSFVHGVLDNGNLATTFCAAAYLLLARTLGDGELGTRRALGLGLVVGLALLTKLLSLLLVPLALLVVLRAGCCTDAARRHALLRGTLLFLLTVVLVSGAFFLRNAQIYGELFASAAHERAYAANRVPEGRLASYLLGRFPRELLQTLTGSFGWGGVQLPAAAVRVLLGAGLAGLLAGLFAAVAPGGALQPGTGVERRARLLFLFAICLLAGALLLRFNLTFRQPQGRYLLPAFGPFALLCVAGWSHLGERWFSPRVRRFVGLLAALAPVPAALVVFGLVWPGLAVEAGRVEPVFASVVARIGTPVAPDKARLRLLAPERDAVLEAPPEFRWELRADAVAESAGGDACYTLHFFDDEGHVLAALYEQAGVSVAATSYAFPVEYWSVFPPGARVHWKVRRLPDRARGESVADAWESDVGTFVRLP